jgi:hypothetical protein
VRIIFLRSIGALAALFMMCCGPVNAAIITYEFSGIFVESDNSSCGSGACFTVDEVLSLSTPASFTYTVRLDNSVAWNSWNSNGSVNHTFFPTLSSTLTLSGTSGAVPADGFYDGTYAIGAGEMIVQDFVSGNEDRFRFGQDTFSANGFDVNFSAQILLGSDSVINSPPPVPPFFPPVGFTSFVFLSDGLQNSYRASGISTTVVPVPPAAWLFGSALGLLGWVRRRKAA